MVALTERRSLAPEGPSPAPRAKIAPSGVIGMLIFILAELMFFAGLLSAFTITRASAVLGIWPPPGQARLPAEATLVNTIALLLSGAALLFAHRAFRRSPASAKQPLLVAIVLGATFVCLQGVEWIGLLRDGVTLTSGSVGAFFYLIVGTHAVHAVAALAALIWAFRRHLQSKLLASQLFTVEAFWYFVVLLWPVIYARVYF